MIFDPNFMGRNGFFWFVGVVEDRMDPLKLGRVKVRAVGWHSEDQNNIPTKDLPWASVLKSTDTAAVSEIGTSPSGLVEGSWVVGFFLDGIEAQEPMVLGSFNGIPITRKAAEAGFCDPRTSTATSPRSPTSASYALGSAASITAPDPGRFPKNLDEPDTSRLARNETTVSTVVKRKQDARALHVNIPAAGGASITQPVIPYGAVYPYNHVTQSESGHSIELDDSLGKERLSLNHRTGTHVEAHPNGDLVMASVSNRFDMAQASSHEHVGAVKNLTVTGNYNIYVKSGSNLNIVVIGGNANIQVTGNVLLDVTGNLNIDVDGNIMETVGGNVTETITGSFTRTVAGTISDTSSAGMTLTAPSVGLSASGNMTTSVGGNQTSTVTGSRSETITGAITQSSGASISLTAPIINLN